MAILSFPVCHRFPFLAPSIRHEKRGEAIGDICRRLLPHRMPCSISYRIASYRLFAPLRKSPRLLYTRGGAIVPDCYSFSRLDLSGDVGGDAVGDDEADGTAHTVEVLIVEDVAGGENGGGAIVAAANDVGGLRGGSASLYMERNFHMRKVDRLPSRWVWPTRI